MNTGHLAYLASPEWAKALQTELVPWLEEVADLGDDVLEIGPGPGLTTDLLRQRAAHLTAVEIDPALATALKSRLANTNVEVIEGDASTLDLATDRFSAVTCFSMLHHMPSAADQDRLFAQLHRALRAGACLLAVDSVESERIRQAHVDDTFVPLDADTLGQRLETAGFTDVAISRAGEYQIRFSAKKAAPSAH
ncbi:class I SAM-dependent methyltransferase [Jatrophihabitans sp. DSM 45814]